MIELLNAQLHFGSTHALDSCCLRIQPGEKVAILGPSGSGKSSLLKVIASEYELDSGSLKISGKEVSLLPPSRLKALRCTIGYIPQDLALVQNLKVSQNILLGSVGSEKLLSTLKKQLFPTNRELQDVLNILTEVGIPEKLFHQVRTLSGGQKQRVAIARALYQNARLILADEPVSSVDPSRAHSLLRCLTSLASKRDTTLLCSLHNQQYAKTYFSRIIGIRDGKILFDGASQSFTHANFLKIYALDDE